MDNNKHIVTVSIGEPREGSPDGKRKPFSPEKVHSRVFEASKDAKDPIIKSVYLSRPMSNGHRHARITVEFIDDLVDKL